MGHDHGAGGHGGGQAAGGMAHRRRLLAVLAISSTVLVVEVIGGLLTGSLALLADAGHMVTDVAGVLLAILAVSAAARPPTPARTFGYLRLEILAALVNAVLLTLVAGFVVVEAVRRWNEPQDIDAPLMLVFAVVGLVANLVGIRLLSGGSRTNLNVKGAYLEVLGDALGSVAAIVAAIVVWASGWERADVVASLAVAALIVPRTWSLLREAVDVLLEATPRGIDLAEVREHILGLPEVLDVHDLHAWTITSGLPVLSAHVVLTDQALSDGLGGRTLDRLGDCLHEHFDVEHCTFQLEARTHRDHEPLSHP